jgi:hypothetical protein
MGAKKQARKLLTRQIYAELLAKGAAQSSMTTVAPTLPLPLGDVSPGQADADMLRRRAAEREALLNSIKLALAEPDVVAASAVLGGSPKKIAKRMARAIMKRQEEDLALEANTIESSLVAGRIAKGDPAYVSRLDQLVKSQHARHDADLLRGRVERARAAVNAEVNEEVRMQKQAVLAAEESKLQKAQAEVRKSGTLVSMAPPRFGELSPLEEDADRLRRNAGRREELARAHSPAAAQTGDAVQGDAVSKLSPEAAEVLAKVQADLAAREREHGRTTFYAPPIQGDNAHEVLAKHERLLGKRRNRK